MTILLVVGVTTGFCALLMFQNFRGTQSLVATTDKDQHVNLGSSRRTRERHGSVVKYHRDQGATFHVASPAAVITEGAGARTQP
jgi:hypothetical protein